MVHIYRIISESGPFKMPFDEAQDKFNFSPALVKAAFMANAMIDLGIHHGIKGFDWDYMPNPFAIKLCSKRAIQKAISNVWKYGIDPQDCFSGQQDV